MRSFVRFRRWRTTCFCCSIAYFRREDSCFGHLGDLVEPRLCTVSFTIRVFLFFISTLTECLRRKTITQPFFQTFYSFLSHSSRLHHQLHYLKLSIQLRQPTLKLCSPLCRSQSSARSSLSNRPSQHSQLQKLLHALSSAFRRRWKKGSI